MKNCAISCLNIIQIYHIIDFWALEFPSKGPWQIKYWLLMKQTQLKRVGYEHPSLKRLFPEKKFWVLKNHIQQYSKIKKN